MILQSCLDSMLNKVEADHAMLKKLRVFEVHLLEFTTLPEVIDFILKELKTVFNLDDVSLSLIDSSGDVSAYLSSYDYDVQQNPDLILLEDKVILVNEFSAGLYTGAYEAHKHEVFFPLREEQPPASISIIPLSRKNQVLGALNLGSYRTDCFFHSFISESMPQLVALIALALENSLQFEILRQIQLSKSMENVNNRHYLEQRLVEELDKGRRSVNCVSCLVLDIVFSKARKNVDPQKLEQYVLESVSTLLKQQLRVNDVLSYYEGKKFAVLLMNVPDECVVQISQRLQKTLKTHKESFSGQAINISALIGHTSYRFKEDDSQSHQEIALKLIDEADTHLQSVEKT